MTNADEFGKELEKEGKKVLTGTAELYVGGQRVASKTVPIGKGGVTVVGSYKIDPKGKIGVTVVGSYKIDPKGKIRAKLILKDADGNELEKTNVSVSKKP